MSSHTRQQLALGQDTAAEDAQSFDKDWDWYANLIDERKESPQWAVIRETRQSHYREFFRTKPGERVLDAGCGNGDYTLLALNDGVRAWAFDLSPKMVACTGRRVASAAMKLEGLHVASVVDLPYPDDCFDVVMCLAVIDHVPAAWRQRAVAELARVLKPGGTLYLSAPNRFAYTWRFGLWLFTRLGKYPQGTIHWFSPREIEDHCRRAGLEPRSSLGLEFMPPFSGIYTTDLRRYSFLPDPVIRVLDSLYLRLERRLRRMETLKPLCFHYFLEAGKPDARPAEKPWRSGKCNPAQPRPTPLRPSRSIREARCPAPVLATSGPRGQPRKCAATAIGTHRQVFATRKL